jgi:prephenate dehydratase
VRLFYLGPEGTHSHEATIGLVEHLAHHQIELVSERTIEDVIYRVNEVGGKDLVGGCVPLENSIQGSVTTAWDTLGRLVREAVGDEKEGLCLIATWRMPIQHWLLTQQKTEYSQIRCVYSHPQALAQCRTWMERHLRHAERIAVASTAEGAKMVAQGPKDVAAIGSKAAAVLHHLRTSTEPIQDTAHNETRFGLVVKNPQAWNPLLTRVVADGAPRFVSVLLVGVENRPGGLLQALVPFHQNGLNITRIESRPVGSRLGEYVFYLDIHWSEPQGNETSEVWKQVTQSLEALQIHAYVLGRGHELSVFP